jgi:hypothetical protein
MTIRKPKALAILLAVCAGVTLAQAQGQTSYTGYLVDIACAAVHRTDNDSWAVTHKRDCLTSTEGMKSGFALVLPKGKILRFDAAGNRKARDLIKREKRDDRWLIEVVGEPKAGPDGDMIAVQSIRLK